ncbi:MAG TPA: beta-N-acetylhexosaminidase [Terriglobales bacterium]|nr:beta-N-acetylhexosaminidase [Terriglobales bacterium]
MTHDLGQLLIVGFEPSEINDALRALLRRIQPAGVILFARNVVTPQQTHQLLQDCQACVDRPLFTCVDMEGGRVDRFRAAIGSFPSAADVFATGDRRLYRRHGRVIGDACRALGFNTDFAPVLDLALEASRTVMSSRAVSPDPKQVVIYAREFMAGLKSSGVIGSGKHFPGLGEANLDTHHELPSVQASYRKLWTDDLYPYRALKRELPLVLVGHANYPVVTRDAGPASLSKKWITDVLRKKIGYRGLVVSDDMEMGALLKAAPIGQAAVEFVRAGGDLCLICRQEELVNNAFEALTLEAEKDKRFAGRVKESVDRVLRFKQKSKELKRRIPAPKPEKVEKLKQQLADFVVRVRPA